MSGTGSEKGKWYNRSGSKDRKEREKEKARHTGQKDHSTQRGGSGAKGGGGHGQKRSGDDDVPTHMNPITVTTTSTAATNTKVCIVTLNNSLSCKRLVVATMMLSSFQHKNIAL